MTDEDRKRHDMFAAAALSGLVAAHDMRYLYQLMDGDTSELKDLVKAAFAIADVMVKEGAWRLRNHA